MYPGKQAQRHPDRPAFVMASSGEAVTYAELDARSNRLAHLLRAQGLKRLDHYAIFMENNSRFLESNGAGERSGLYYTAINAFLQSDEVAYIVANSEAQVLITSMAKRDIAVDTVITVKGFFDWPVSRSHERVLEAETGVKPARYRAPLRAAGLDPRLRLQPRASMRSTP